MLESNSVGPCTWDSQQHDKERLAAPKMNALGTWLVLIALCQSVGALWPRTPFQAVNYLLRYGYLNPDYSMRTNPSKVLVYAIKNFQIKSLLNVTGEMDDSTMHQMQRKRCGVPDFSGPKLRQIFHSPTILIELSKRDATQAHWDKTDLTYFIKNYTQDLPKEVTDETIKRALQVWANVSKLTFTEVSDDSADIVISFAQGAHGDGVPFDGPGGTLAHAYFPKTNEDPLEGDAHFDEDETWIVDHDKNGTNLFCTAVHEFGHSLGLVHTFYSSDIMYPFETDCENFRLSENDIYTIQQLYGKPDNSTTTTQSVQESTVTPKLTTPDTTSTSTMLPTTSSLAPITSTENPSTSTYKTTAAGSSPPTSPSTSTTFETRVTTRRPSTIFPELCEGYIRAILYGADGNLYVFLDILVFMVYPNGFVQDFYLFITDIFPRAPEYIDAAFTVKLDTKEENGHSSFTYIIKDNRVWKYYYDSYYQHFQLAVGYPTYKSDDFPGAPKYIRAAFYDDGITYLLDYEKYTTYRYNCERSSFESLTQSKSVGTPQYLQNLPWDIPIDAAWVRDDHHLNLFAGEELYIIDTAGNIKEKSNNKIFFGCEAVVVPDRHGHSHGGRKHSHRGRKHSPRRHKHSPRKGKHSHKHRKGSHKHRKGSHKHRKGSHKRKNHRGSGRH